MAKKKSDRDTSSGRRRRVKRGSREPEIPLLTWTRPVKFPEGKDQLKEAFRILNAWARRLQAWENRVRAMGGIMEATLNMSAGQFDSVLRSVADKKHSKAEIREAYNAGYPGGGVGPSSDVLGHPPDPPFQEPIT